MTIPEHTITSLRIIANEIHDLTTLRDLEAIKTLDVSLTFGVNSQGVFWVRSQTPKLMSATATSGSLSLAVSKALRDLALRLEMSLD